MPAPLHRRSLFSVAAIVPAYLMARRTWLLRAVKTRRYELPPGEPLPPPLPDAPEPVYPFTYNKRRIVHIMRVLP